MKTIWKVLTAPFLALVWLAFRIYLRFRKPLPTPEPETGPTRKWTLADEYAKRSACAVTGVTKAYWARRMCEEYGTQPMNSRVARSMTPEQWKQICQRKRAQAEIAAGKIPPPEDSGPRKPKPELSKNQAKKLRKRRREKGLK
jgi:hypothetical protein